MKLIQVKNYRELSKKAAELVINEIKRNPKLVLGLATGKTPKGLYKKLVKAYRKGEIDFSKIKTFNLDEYYPMEKESKKSYRHYLFKRLFNKINIKKENIILLDGSSKDWKKECTNYELKIKKNPIDLQILGVGVNGHIAFNEPGSEFSSKTRLVDLIHVKGKALSMGISTILKAKKIILLAFGRKKAKIIRELIKGNDNRNIPVNFLKEHKNLIVIVDKNASSLL